MRNNYQKRSQQGGYMNRENKQNFEIQRESSREAQNSSKEASQYNHKDTVQNRERYGFGRERNSQQYRNRDYNNGRHQKIKVEETIDDIKQDIQRIEKEILLEIKEIKTMRLGI